MKVKEYLVSEIIDLKRDLNNVRMDCANREKIINTQHDTIERLEKHGEEYRAHIDHINGILCEVRMIISDNLLQELPDYRPVKLSINSEGTKKEKGDFTRLLNLLGIPEEKEVPDEIPED